jgi:PTH1 family peptidyl-tRNA hydrolase
VKLIVGLGNPGRSYAATRHNVGWWVADHLADVWHFAGWKKSLNAELSRGRVGDHDVHLLKPTTYMNLSGYALGPYLNDRRIDAQRDLLVVVDDVALPIGRYRIRASGSAGGHNGLKSIEAEVGSQRYARLRVGVGPPEERDRGAILGDYVLDTMGKEERAVVIGLFPELVGAIEAWVDHGVDKAMNRYNRRRNDEEGKEQDPDNGEAAG